MRRWNIVIALTLCLLLLIASVPPADAQYFPPETKVWVGTTSQNQSIRVVTEGSLIKAWLITLHVQGEEQDLDCSSFYTSINYGDLGIIRSGYFFTSTIDTEKELLIIEGQMWGNVASGWIWWSTREGATNVCPGQGELTWSARWNPPTPTPVPAPQPPPFPVPPVLPETGVDPDDPPTPTPGPVP
jgi:hypothetical protein